MRSGGAKRHPKGPPRRNRKSKKKRRRTRGQNCHPKWPQHSLGRGVLGPVGPRGRHIIKIKSIKSKKSKNQTADLTRPGPKARRICFDSLYFLFGFFVKVPGEPYKGAGCTVMLVKVQKRKGAGWHAKVPGGPKHEIQGIQNKKYKQLAKGAGWQTTVPGPFRPAPPRRPAAVPTGPWPADCVGDSGGAERSGTAGRDCWMERDGGDSCGAARRSGAERTRHFCLPPGTFC